MATVQNTKHVKSSLIFSNNCFRILTCTKSQAPVAASVSLYLKLLVHEKDDMKKATCSAEGKFLLHNFVSFSVWFDVLLGHRSLHALVQGSSKICSQNLVECFLVAWRTRRHGIMMIGVWFSPKPRYQHQTLQAVSEGGDQSRCTPSSINNKY